jgi:hypothetical protein
MVIDKKNLLLPLDTEIGNQPNMSCITVLGILNKQDEIRLVKRSKIEKVGRKKAWDGE